MRTEIAAAVAVLVILLFPFVHQASASAANKRFVVSVDLVVAGKPFHGDAVWEMTSETQCCSFGNGLTYRHSVRGEAIAIPITDDLVVFVLRRAKGFVSSHAYGALLAECGAVMPPALASFEGRCDIHDLPEIVVAHGELDDSQLPELTRVNESLADGLSIKLVGVTAHVTAEARNSSLKARYPWIASLPSGRGGSVSPRKLYQIDFVAE